MSQLYPLRGLANLFAGEDEPVLMNVLYGRILSDEERARLHDTAVALLMHQFPWLNEVRDRGLTTGSPELSAWINLKTPIFGVNLPVEPLMVPRRTVDTRVVLDPNTSSRSLPYAT